MSAKPKVHLTGGQGFIGRAVAAALGGVADVAVSDVGDMNVTSHEAVLARFEKDKPDLVIHLAGLMGATGSKKSPYPYHHVNAFGTLNVLEGAHAAGARSFILLSSLTVHGANGPGDEPKRESDPFNPMHPYAVSKVISEYMVRDFSKHAKLNTIILRPTIVTGNLAGENNSINEFCRDALAARDISLYGPGTHRREWISVGDLAGAVKLAAPRVLDRPVGEGACEEFIISSGQPVSMVDLAHRCIALAGGGHVVHVEKKVQAFSLTADVGKARDVLGWQPANTVDDLISGVVAQLRALK